MMPEQRGLFRKVAILAEGTFDPLGSKTANCVIRFSPERVACVIDSGQKGRVVSDVLGFGGAIPVVGSIDEALRLSPDSFLIGVAPPGGRFPPPWRPLVRRAIDAGLDVASGLHDLLCDDAEFAALASKRGVRLWDLRKPPDDIPFRTALRRTTASKVILVAGTDCDVGKMTVSFLLAEALAARGVSAEVAPTGQTGIFLAGWGIALDRIVSDFIIAATDHLVAETAKRGAPDVILVEGQGTLLHPLYAAVAMGILFGARPDAILLCHDPTRTAYLHFTEPIPPVEQVIRVHEELARYVHPARVIALPLCSPASSDDAAARAAAGIEARLGLPAEDPVRSGGARLVDAVLSFLCVQGPARAPEEQTNAPEERTP